MLKRIPDDTTLPIGFSADFLEAVCNLIEYFILRQQLVVLAMVTHNPSFLEKVTRIDLRPYLDVRREEWLKRRKLIAEQGMSPAVPLPIWKHDWRCFAHGHGCKLTHLVTGEPLEWDSPDRSAFTIYWFLNHLDWRLKHELDDPYVRRCADWLERNHADRAVVEKAINCLIDLDVLDVSMSHVCRFTEDVMATPSDPLPDEVVSAFFSTLMHFRQRQRMAIEAMVDLRPDFIVQVAEDLYVLPETATRLKSLYQHLESRPKSGKKIQTGEWREDWTYDIRYATCTVKHTTTEEPIRWSTSDPLYVDEHGYMQHLLWRFESEGEHADLKTIYTWAEQNANGTSDAFTGLIVLINRLAITKKIKFTRNEKGILIKSDRPT